MALIALVVVSGLPVTAFLAWLIVPGYGWRPMFAIAGLGALARSGTCARICRKAEHARLILSRWQGKGVFDTEFAIIRAIR